MFTKTHFFLIFLFLMASTALSAQDQFERLYRSDRQNTAIDVAHTSDEGYLVLSGGRHLDSLEFDFYNITKFDNKGILSWSKDYSFEHNIFPDGSLTVLEGDSFVISGVLDTTSINKFLMKAGPSGDVAWTRGFGRDDSVAPLLLGDACTGLTYRNGFFLAGNVYNSALATDIYLAEADEMGNQLWAKAYGDGGTVGFLSSKVSMTQDSGAIICGSDVNLTDTDIFLVKTDSIGNIEWSRTYGESGIVEIGTTVAPTPDGGYLVGARKVNPILPSHPGVLIKTDTFGITQWVLNVDFQTSDTVYINDLIIADDGDAVVSGSLLGAMDTFAFMMKVSLTGDIVWKRRYKASTRQFVFSNGLMESVIGGFVYLTNSDEGDEQVGPYLIKTDEDGTTICDTIIDQQLLFPTTILSDTIILTTTDVMDSKDITVVDTLNYNGIVTANVSLESFGPYCPDEVFSDTLDATTDGAVAYEWSTGETTPTIVVTSPDEYRVTVTIGVDYCYILCASTTINERELPTVEVDFSDGSFCSTGTVTLSASPMSADDILWSTGETTSAIVVDAEAIYTVTASNVCGDATETIGVTFNTGPPTLSIASNDSLCTAGVEQITLTTSYPVNTFEWSTGDTEPVIEVIGPGTYSVTAISNFCDDASTEISIEPCPVFYDIGNAFTPNNDDTSDSFMPLFSFDPSQLVEYQFTIYSRWGDVVFETTDPLEGWDGMVNEELGATDVYFFRVSGVDSEGGDLKRFNDQSNHGDVTLIR